MIHDYFVMFLVCIFGRENNQRKRHMLGTMHQVSAGIKHVMFNQMVNVIHRVVDVGPNVHFIYPNRLIHNILRI